MIGSEVATVAPWLTSAVLRVSRTLSERDNEYYKNNTRNILKDSSIKKKISISHIVEENWNSTFLIVQNSVLKF